MSQLRSGLGSRHDSRTTALLVHDRGDAMSSSQTMCILRLRIQGLGRASRISEMMIWTLATIFRFETGLKPFLKGEVKDRLHECAVESCADVESRYDVIGCGEHSPMSLD